MDPISSPAPPAPAPLFREKAPAEAGDRARVTLGQIPREELLRARIKDLQLHLAGTRLEKIIQQLYSELEAKGLSMRPEVYLSDQWGCPSGVPVIGVPFYLADPSLTSIEAELGGWAEDEREILRYLRHEAGHAFNYAYRLYDTEEWRKLFGDYQKPYKEEYKPKPFSRRYVKHISGWYAQKHPDEDFAETFAVWLTPDSNWQKKYAGWPALKKLAYVEQAAQRLGRQKAEVSLAEPDLDVSEMEETVLDHYRQRELEEQIDLQLQEHFDQDLTELFEAPGAAPVKAETLVRSERASLISAVSHYSGVSRSVVRALVDHLASRTSALGLTVQLDKTREYVARLSTLVTALAMNFLYTDKFFDE